MKISDELIRYLESLARIELTDDQRAACETDLQSILSYIDTLNELDTDSVQPLSHAFDVSNVMREDEIKTVTTATPSWPMRRTSWTAASRYRRPWTKGGRIWN